MPQLAAPHSSSASLIPPPLPLIPTPHHQPTLYPPPSLQDGVEFANALTEECGVGRIELLGLATGVHDWPILPFCDVCRGDSGKGMDQIAEFASLGIAKPS